MIDTRIKRAEPPHRSVWPGTLIMALLLLGACASSGPSIAVVDQSLTKASTAVSEAEEVGAQQHAPLALSDAQEKMVQAQKAKADGRHAEALRLAEEAEVDAEYAEAKALSAKAEQAAKELRESIRTLREEIEPETSN